MAPQKKNYSLTIRTEYAGAPLRVVARVGMYCKGTEPKWVDVNLPGTVRWEHPFQKVTVAVLTGGYWGMAFQAPHHQPLIASLIALPPGPRGWWHALTGAQPRAESPLKIGVIDESLPRLTLSDALGHVDNLGGVGFDRRYKDPERAYRTRDWDHGYSVCAVLAARPTAPDSYEGIAPESRVIFASAGHPDSAAIDVGVAARTVDILSHDHQCDVITLSAGGIGGPSNALHMALKAAQSRGTLCFVAAGNSPGTPDFPALYPECLSVGAIGHRHFAPPQTSQLLDEKSAIVTTDEWFLWHFSATGPQVGFLGPGAGVFFSDVKREPHVATGTSYASPIVAGIAARLLASDATYRRHGRTAKRVTYAAQFLQQKARNVLNGASRFGIIDAR